MMLQDTSTQAMTEVALGLSMAFFALLIIALMSVSLPTSVDSNKQALKHAQSETVDITEQVSLSIQETQNEQGKEAIAPSNNELVLLYWGGQFFDTQQQIVNIDNVNAQENVIVAVNPQIPFNQLISIQTQFAGKTLRLTKLSEQWQFALSNNSLNVHGSGQK